MDRTDFPNSITFLKSLIRPTSGGDTVYADTISAYEALPEDIKQRVQGKTAHYSYLKFRNEIPGVSTDEERAYLSRGSDHPIITQHPVTGKKNIFANPGHTASVNGVSAEESKELLDLLFAHVNQPQFIYSHPWEEFDGVLWDNRAVQHKASPAPDSPRRLVRTTITGLVLPQEVVDVSAVVQRPLCIPGLVATNGGATVEL